MAAYYYRKALRKRLMKGRSIKEMAVATMYAACKEMSIPRRLEDIAKEADADFIFAGRCFRILVRELGINHSLVDASRHISKVALNANIRQGTYRAAVDMLDIVKKNSISDGKDPKALASAVLYAACLLKREENISQTKMAQAGDISVVTLRKRLRDVSVLFPELRNVTLRTEGGPTCKYRCYR